MFNAEDFIENCITSVIKQDLNFDAYEIIVVNDGSTDNSSIIVEKLKENYSNIKLINQQNKGNGAARNTGLDNSLGDYIYYLDADDYIAHNVLGRILSVIRKHDLDIIGFRSVDTTFSNLTESTNIAQFPKIENILGGIEFIANYDYEAEVWWYITKRNFLINTGLRFYDRKFVQDSYYTPTLFLQAKRMAFLPLDAHRYRKSLNSITRKKDPVHFRRHIDDMLFSVDKLHHLIANLQLQKIDQDCISRLNKKKQRYAFLVMTRIMRSNLKIKEINKIIDIFKKMDVYPIGNFDGKNYSNHIFQLLTIIFNNKILFYPSLMGYRILKRIVR